MIIKGILIVFKPIADIYNAFFTNDKGMSLRKIGFVFALLCAYQLQTSITDDHIKQNVISAWQIFGAVCVGLVTIPELIKVLSAKDVKSDTAGGQQEVK
jgi:uncharacterized membrane protein